MSSGGVTLPATFPLTFLLLEDIDVTTSPIFSGWTAALIVGNPISGGPVVADTTWVAGATFLNPWAAGPVTTGYSAGPVVVQAGLEFLT